jgi:hypothetical protein
MERISLFGKILPIGWLILAIILSQPLPVSAGFNAWTGIGPEGGWIYALAIDPTNPNTIYAGTYGGGVFKSANGVICIIIYTDHL